MASSSSFVNNKSEYDVFLSFRGETRNNFTSHLYNALKTENINVFIDRSLEKGLELTPALHKAIDDAKISVVVVSSDYASSTYCLEELAKMMECKESKGQTVLPIFYYVEPSNLRKLKGSFEKAFAEHEAKFKKETEKVERWKSAVCKAGHLTGWPVKPESDEAEVIRDIIKEISKILNWKPTSKGQEMITIPLVGKTTAIYNLEKIWKYLMDENISRVGIHGMGGVGKTTVATHINNRLIRDDSIQHVYWVTVSKDSSINKLQSKIAEKLDLDLTRNVDEKERAAKLWGALNKKKFVLILDDMWESFELEEVGIPISTDGGKLLLTTRDLSICNRMKCEGIVKVEPLGKVEAMDLFTRECGHQIDDNLEFRNLVESVVKECDGLPLAIKVIARSMRGFATIYKWRNILKELQKPSIRQNQDMEKVFNLLKVSYDHLQNDKHRQCLHYCAMHPEDYSIERNDLIEFCIAGGIIDELDNRQEEFDMGNTLIDELINASLLEHSHATKVKLHDVLRDMVLSITKGKLMVKTGIQPQDFLKFSDWSTNLEGISIMGNYHFEVCSLNLAPNCKKLRILLMRNNENISELPKCFFLHMQNLTCLDMGFLWSLKLLPDSISKLEALRMLNLEACSSLEYIPSFSALKYLRHLNLSGTNLRNLPEGLEKLVNLKLLYIIDAKILCALIPSEVLKGLSLLESLNLNGTNVEVDVNAIISLKKLETLGVKFKNFDALNSYLVSGHWQRLEKYYISNKSKEFEVEEFDRRSNKALLWCKDSPLDCDSATRNSTDFIIPPDVEQLILKNWDNPLDRALINGCFAHLRDLTLIKCKINYLISAVFAKQLLENVGRLAVGECASIEEIIRTEESLNQSNHKNYPTIKLPHLSSLSLRNLPGLRSIYRGYMDLPSLRSLEIVGCKKLESPYSSSHEYDVFLSFGGKISYNFTSHLYNTLKKANIKVFFDKGLEKEENLTPPLHEVIIGAKISVVVFSPNYALSTFCLDELAKIIECRQVLFPLFYHVDPFDVRRVKGRYEGDFEKYKSIFKGEMEKVQRWKSAFAKAGGLAGWVVDHIRDEAEIIQKLFLRIWRELNCERTNFK